MVTRAAREESGFGMIELLMAIVMLNIGILAIIGALNSGALALGRASTTATAATLAETQMEGYRGLKYTNVVFDTTEWNAAVGDASYTADPVYQQNMANPVAPKALVASITGGACTATGSPATVPASCDPSRVVRGPDGKSYRVDTYLYYDTPNGGQQLKVVTVVVRAATQLTTALARISSTFDSSSGQ
jgi:type II secretory pathway pseudopilin PulG